MFDEVRAALSAVTFEDMGRPEIVAVLDAATKVRSALDALEVRAGAALERLGDAGAGPAAVFRAASKSSQRDADRRARRVQRLASLPQATEALGAGRITAEHADALGAAAERVSPEAVAASGLVHVAERRPADLFAREVREWVHAEECERDREAAERAAEERHRRQRDARRLVIFDRGDGMTVLHGEFDPVTGAELRRVIGAEANRLFHIDGGRDEARDVRSTGQRAADALHSLVCAPAGLRDGPSGLVTPPPPRRHQLIITATIDHEAGTVGNGWIPGSGPLPHAELQRLACNSDLVGLVFSGEGQPLWLGRKVRLASDGQWLALVARDRGCRGCGMDPSRCEAHHIVAWAPPHRGPTDITNLVLLCRHCHHLLHNQGWQLEWDGGGWGLSPPGRGWRDPADMARQQPARRDCL